MKLNPYCMCCAVNKQEEKIRKFPDMDKKTEYMKKVMSILSSAEEQDCSPSLSVEIKKLYSEFWNCPAEDYTEIKKEFNQLMLNVEASVEEKIRTSADPLETALLYARIGNYIDFAALENVSQETMLKLLENENQEPLSQTEYANFQTDLSTAKTLVYLTDNSERLFFGFFDAFVSYAAVTATFFPVSLILHHAHTIKQLIPAAFNFFSVFSAFLRSV